MEKIKTSKPHHTTLSLASRLDNTPIHGRICLAGLSLDSRMRLLISSNTLDFLPPYVLARLRA